jgi:hypothetical protein
LEEMTSEKGLKPESPIARRAARRLLGRWEGREWGAQVSDEVSQEWEEMNAVWSAHLSTLPLLAFFRRRLRPGVPPDHHASPWVLDLCRNWKCFCCSHRHCCRKRYWWEASQG